MHVWTHLKPSSQGKTGIGLYPDGMLEHDELVGTLLKKIDDIGLRDNTIVIYSTDNGAETVTWPDGGTTPSHGEKGTTLEGGLQHTVPHTLAGSHSTWNRLQQHHVARRLDANAPCCSRCS